MYSGLYIVIVNWNLVNDTSACIDSLIQAGASADQIILVDNGSSDGSVSALRTRFGTSLNIIENTHNLGFAHASNQGIQLALDQGAGWILLLNNDTLAAPDFLQEFEKAARSTALYAILAPMIFYHDAPDRIWYFGDHLIPGTLITTNPYHGKVYNNHLPELVPVDFVSGCAMLVRRDVFDQIGLLDASLVMYGEEVDFCWRARQAGFHLAALTKPRIWHKVSLSANRDKPRTRYLRIRNQVRFYKKYARGFLLLLMLLFSGLRIMGIIVSDLFKRQAPLIPPTLQGWMDGWKYP